MEQLLFLLFFAAPLIQLVLCILRYRDKIILPIGATTFFAFILGILLSFGVQNLVDDLHPPHPHPAAPMALAFGVLITTFSILPIGIVVWIFYHFKHKSDSGKTPVNNPYLGILKNSYIQNIR